MYKTIQTKFRKIKEKIITTIRPDVYVVSYPKCGRTWLKALIGKYLSLKYALSEDLVLSPQIISRMSGLPRVVFTHAGTGIGANTKFNKDLLGERHKQPFKKVILLGREIKDILVSSYFHSTKRSFLFEGSISDFIASDRFGVLRILEFYELWFRTRHQAKSFLFIRYEDLHKDPHGTLMKVLNFIGEVGINETIVNQSVEYCAFENFRKLEMQDRFKRRIFRPRNPNDPESFKTRKGKIGGYVNYLSPEDVVFIDESIERQEFDFGMFENR